MTGAPSERLPEREAHGDRQAQDGAPGSLLLGHRLHAHLLRVGKAIADVEAHGAHWSRVPETEAWRQMWIREADLSDGSDEVARIHEERAAKRSNQREADLHGGLPERQATQRAKARRICGSTRGGALAELFFTGSRARQEISKNALRSHATKWIATVRVRAAGVEGAEEKELLIAPHLIWVERWIVRAARLQGTPVVLWEEEAHGCPRRERHRLRDRHVGADLGLLLDARGVAAEDEAGDLNRVAEKDSPMRLERIVTKIENGGQLGIGDVDRLERVRADVRERRVGLPVVRRRDIEMMAEEATPHAGLGLHLDVADDVLVLGLDLAETRIEERIYVELANDEPRRAAFEKRGLGQLCAHAVSRQHVPRRLEVVHPRRIQNDAWLCLERELSQAAEEVLVLPAESEVARPLQDVEAHPAAHPEGAERRLLDRHGNRH